MWFDQGWLGLIAFLVLSLAALAAASSVARTSGATGLAFFTGMADIFVVRVFDTLVDATRLAAIFHMTCLVVTTENVKLRSLRSHLD